MVTHAKVSAKSDGGDSSLVLPSDWNDLHDSDGGFPLDRRESSGLLHATYGDDFSEGSLNARWSRHVVGSGEETYQVDGSSTLRVTYSNAAATRYHYQTAPNNTNETWEISWTPWQDNGTGEIFALLMLDSSGNGVCQFLYDNSMGHYLGVMASHAYSSGPVVKVYPVMGWPNTGRRVWQRLRKAGGVYYGSFSFNGHTYCPEITYTPSAFTPTRVGFGRIYGTDPDDVADLHWFDKTA